MPPRATPEQIADHARDHRKNYIPPLDAHTIAILARAPSTSFDEAVEVIQKFANACASQAAFDSAKATGAAVMAVFGSVIKESTDA